MTGFILAAGFGTRLKPLSDFIPKALVPACGRPLLQRWIDFFRCAGIARMGVNAHHHADQVKAFLDAQETPCSLFHEEDRIRGTGGSWYFAREFLAKHPMFCVANVDIFASIYFASLAGAFRRLNCAVGLIAIRGEKGTVRYNGALSEQVAFSISLPCTGLQIGQYSRCALHALTISLTFLAAMMGP